MKKFDRFPGSLDAQPAIIQELQLQIADLNTRHELIQAALTEKENEVDSLHVIIKDLNSELEKSKESRVYLHSIHKAAPIGIGIVLNRTFVELNDTLCEMLGFSCEELIGKNARIIYPSDEEYERVGKIKYGQIQKSGIGSVETCFRRNDGQIIDVILQSIVIDPQDISKGVLFTVVDISERKRAEKEAKEQERLLKKIFEVLPIGLWIADKNGYLQAGNPAGVRIWGGEPHVGPPNYGVFRARRFPSGENINPEDWALNYTVRDGVTIENELLEIEGFDGVRRIISNYTAPVLGEDGTIQAAIVVNMDISDLKIIEQKFLDALHEKEVLLRELYHRTKNNMFLISSMLSLQASHQEDEKIYRVLKDLEDRIHAMALVHEKLYESNNLYSIDLKEYFVDLTDLIWSSYAVTDRRTELHLDLESVHVKIDEAIPCGLILKELITNSLRHAFCDGNDVDGMIEVRLKKLADGTIDFLVRDNGKGVPEGFDFRSQNSLGLRTIIRLVEHQLKGQIDFSVESGVQCWIRFQEPGT